MVLRSWIYANRLAPVDPPSRATCDELFNRAARGQKHGLTQAEFERLTTVLGLRVSTRVLINLIIKFVLSPLLSWWLVRMFRVSTRGILSASSSVLPAALGAKLTPEGFRTVRMILLSNQQRSVPIQAPLHTIFHDWACLCAPQALTITFVMTLNNIMKPLVDCLFAATPFANAILGGTAHVQRAGDA